MHLEQSTLASRVVQCNMETAQIVQFESVQNLHDDGKNYTAICNDGVMAYVLILAPAPLQCEPAWFESIFLCGIQVSIFKWSWNKDKWSLPPLETLII